MLRSAALIALTVSSLAAGSSAHAAEFITLAGFGAAEPRVRASLGDVAVTAPTVLAAGPGDTFAYGSGGRVVWVAGGVIARVELLQGVAALAFTSDGSLLAVQAGDEAGERSVLWRYPREGQRVRVAGKRGRMGDDGDGGAARAASLDCPSAIDVDVAGGILLADPCASRVRRVAPDGTISTVAGTGAPEHSGDGVPAVSAGLRAPRDVTVLPSGGFAVLDVVRSDELFPRAARVRVVDAAGVIRTRRTVNATAMSAAPDGSLLLVDSNDIRLAPKLWVKRLSLDNTIERLVQREDRVGTTWRLPVVGDLNLAQVDDVVVLSDGGALVAVGAEVHYVPNATPGLLATAILPATRTPRPQTVVSVRTTQSAQVEVVVRRDGQLVATTEVIELPAGDSKVRLRLLRPALYDVRVRARSGRQLASARAEVLLGGFLSIAFARTFVRNRPEHFSPVVGRRSAQLRCLRRSLRQVSCEIHLREHCRGTAYVRMRIDGSIEPRWRAICRRRGGR